MSEIVGYGSNNFSTEEQIVGKWIDGKPLYQKTIDCGALPNTTSKDINHNIADVERIWLYSGVAWGTVDTEIMPLPYLVVSSSGATNSAVGVTVNRVRIRITTGSDRTSYTNSYITIQYTKTTD